MSTCQIPVLTPAQRFAIDQYLETLFTQLKETGRKLQQVALKRSQIRGFETLVTATTRFSEIRNFIKNQAGKEKGKEQKWRKISEELLAQLDTLENKAREISPDDEGQQLVIKLKLARGWAKQIVTQCLYSEMLHEGGN